MSKKVFYITGIDTDIGKTICTGLLAKWLIGNNSSVITQKPIQTGCIGVSEDISFHRALMNTGLLPEDSEGYTCSYLFNRPCSPHLAARLENRQIDITVIAEATKHLLSKYDTILIEGAGGLCAPMTDSVSSIDYVQQENLPVIIVSSSRLGSISHTLSLVELCNHRKVGIAGILYNRFNETDKDIGDDSRMFIKQGLESFGFYCPIIDIYDYRQKEEYDFSQLLL